MAGRVLAAQAGVPASEVSWATSARAVFGQLLAHGKLTRGELADLTGMSRVVSSWVVNRLVAMGYVESAGVLPGRSGGPNARSYALVPTAGYTAGVAIQPSSISVTVSALTGTTVGHADVPVEREGDTALLVRRSLLAVLDAAGVSPSRLRHIVLGCPGVIGRDAWEVVYSAHNPRWQRGLAADLRDVLPCAVTLENDVNLAALAEARLRADRGETDVVLVWLDGGVAFGAVLGGQIFRGAAGWAGEIGYVPVAVDDTTPGSRAVAGILQRSVALASVTALSQRISEEPFVVELARRIAVAVAIPAFTFDPDVVVLAGRVTAMGGPALVEAVGAALADLGPVPVRVETSSAGPEAMVAGTEILALQRARDELFDLPEGSTLYDVSDRTSAVMQ